MKKLLVVLMALAMVVSMLAAFPFAASADGEEGSSAAVWSGKANIKWYVDTLVEDPETGKLVPNVDEFHLQTAEDLAGLAYLVNAAYDKSTLKTCYNGVWYDVATGEVLGFQRSGFETGYYFDYEALGLYIPRPQEGEQTDGYTTTNGIYRPVYSEDEDIVDPIDGSAFIDGDEFADKTVYLETDVIVNEGTPSEWGEAAPARTWMPIGGGRNSDATLSRFQGTFLGRGHTISGLYFSEEENKTSRVGLFGFLKNAYIRDLVVENSYFAGYIHIGGIAGTVADAEFYNCHVKSTVLKGDSSIGGLAGALNGGGLMIEQCSVIDINVEGQKSVGAIAGLLNYQSLFAADCMATGQVKACTVTGSDGSTTGGWDVGVISGRAGQATVTVVNFISVVTLTQEATEGNLAYSASYGLVWGGVGNNGKPEGNGRIIFSNNAVLENCYYVSDFHGNGEEIKFPTAEKVEQKSDLYGTTISRYVVGLDFEDVWAIGAKGELPTLRNVGKETDDSGSGEDPHGGEQEELDHVTKHEWFADNWVEEKAATCDKAGTKGHYPCSCGKNFDKDHNELDDLTIPALGHTYGELIPEKAATADAEGEKAHYECSTCHKLFDENKNPVTRADITIPKTEKKGCFGVVAGVPFVAAVVLGAVVLMRKKEEKNK